MRPCFMHFTSTMTFFEAVAISNSMDGKSVWNVAVTPNYPAPAPGGAELQLQPQHYEPAPV
jgi:hypothetical protein